MTDIEATQNDQSRIPTLPRGMPAVVPPLTLEERVAAIESVVNEIKSYTDALKIERPKLLNDITSELNAIKAGLADEKTKREDLARQVTDLVAKVDTLTEGVKELKTDVKGVTTMLAPIGENVLSITKSVSSAFANPDVRRLAYSGLGSAVFIAACAAAYLRGQPVPSQQVTAPAVVATQAQPTIVIVPTPTPTAAPVIAPRADAGAVGQ